MNYNKSLYGDNRFIFIIVLILVSIAQPFAIFWLFNVVFDAKIEYSLRNLVIMMVFVMAQYIIRTRLRK